MNKTPFKDYGFEYKLNDKNYSFAVLAPSATEAKRMVSAMSDAILVGQVKPDNRVRQV